MDSKKRHWRRSRRLRMEHLEARDLLAGFDLLVFSKTAGFRQDSIAAGIASRYASSSAKFFITLRSAVRR